MGLGFIQLVTWAALLETAYSNYPVFDVNSKMTNLLLPADVRIGSVIYRLRATDSDRDYPLIFDATDYGSYVIKVENLPCNKSSSYCEANVFLERSLAPNQVFKFRMTVRDSQGDTTTVPVSVKVTDGTTDFNEVFPHVPGVIMIPENTAVGTELEYVIVKKHPRAVRQSILELWGSSEFKIAQTSKKGTTTGVIVLAEPLDYEQKTMYRLSVYATGMWVDLATDSRNIAGFQLVVIVTDVQDSPPVFDPIEPITSISPNLTVGGSILRVTAKDGDKGSPRPIRYGLLPEGNPHTVFFSIDQDTGDIKLARPLSELATVSRSHQPILLTVLAEEIVQNDYKKDASPTTATTTVALLLGPVGNSPPYFESPNYATQIDENSPQGTTLVFGDPYVTEVRDNDMGKRGVFSLLLENNNGTFEVSPTVGERQSPFIIRVRDNKMLDYEVNKELRFKIVAKEVSPEEQPLSTSVEVVVYIKDINDNSPVFSQLNYSSTISENATAGQTLVKFECTDLDTGDAGVVKFTSISGPKNSSLNLDWDLGLLTIGTDNHGFDREESSSFRFFVEARDMVGTGNKAVVPFTLYLLDANDNSPIFERNPMEFVLSSDGSNFSQPAFVKAYDADAEPPNNIVRYEIISGNYGNKFYLDAVTGELRVNSRNRAGREAKESIGELSVRAYDLGVPTMFAIGQVRIFPAESAVRHMTFVVPGKNLDTRTVHQLLSELTGARVIIHSLERYEGRPGENPSQNDVEKNDAMDKYIITATVLYPSGSTVVDLDTLQRRLANRTNVPIRPQEEEIQKTSKSEVIYRTETDTIFWILLILILLLLLILLILLLCCLCEFCPCYGTINRLVRRKSSVQATNVNYVNKTNENERESKSVQAEWLRSAHREAWSAEPPRQWYFNRRHSDRRLLLLAERAPPQPPQPNVVYTRELGETRLLEPQRQPNELIVEDVHGTEYRLLDPSRLSFRRSPAGSPSIRRAPDQEVHQQQPQGSDQGFQPLDIHLKGAEGRPPTRDEEYFRDGNAEILRLVTRGKDEGGEDEDDEPTINQPQRPYTHEEGEGKEELMKKFIQDSDNKRIENVQESGELLKRAISIRENVLSTADINRLTSIQRDLLLTRFLVEENRRVRNNSIGDETQSLPGVVTMATQTDSHAETQTEKTYFSKRRTKSDNDDSLSDSDENFKRRFKKSVRSKLTLGRAVDAFQKRSKEIKTPIIEEPDMYEGVTKNGTFAETKASLLRHAATRTKLGLDDPEKHGNPHLQDGQKIRSMSVQDIAKLSARREDVVRSLHATPVKKINILHNVHVEEVMHDEQEEDASFVNSIQPSHSSINKKKRPPLLSSKDSTKRQLSSEPLRSRQSSKESTNNSSNEKETSSRYMEWYNKRYDPKVNRPETNEKDKIVKKELDKLVGRNPPKWRPVLKQSKTRTIPFPKAPRVVDVDEELDPSDHKTKENSSQHSELHADVDDFKPSLDDKSLGEDDDSGIAVPYLPAGSLRHQQAMEKKSIFTIAYDDMETKNIRLDTASP